VIVLCEDCNVPTEDGGTFCSACIDATLDAADDLPADVVDEPVPGRVTEPAVGHADLHGPDLARAALAEALTRRDRVTS
jgi:hypothetical protein